MAKKIVKDFEEGKQVPTQELAAAMRGDVKAPSQLRYIAYAPFDFKTKHYESGDEFMLPENMTRDTDFDLFRAVEKRRGNGTELGIAFIELGDIISSNPKVRKDPNAERYTYRHILPLKEA